MNGLALLVMAAGMVVGPVWESSFAVVGLMDFGIVVNGWNDFKKFSFKEEMCRFAYTPWWLVEKLWLWELPVERPVTLPRKHWKQLLITR